MWQTPTAFTFTLIQDGVFFFCFFASSHCFYVPVVCFVIFFNVKNTNWWVGWGPTLWATLKHPFINLDIRLLPLSTPLLSVLVRVSLRHVESIVHTTVPDLSMDCFFLKKIAAQLRCSQLCFQNSESFTILINLHWRTVSYWQCLLKTSHCTQIFSKVNINNCIDCFTILQFKLG